MQNQTLDELTNGMFAYMRNIDYRDETIYRYHVKWRRVKNFMLKNRIEYFDVDTGNAYLKSVIGDYTYSKLNFKNKEIVNSVRVLTDFQKTGKIKKGPKEHQPRVYNGEIGHLILDCISKREKSLMLCKKSVQAYKTTLYQLYEYLTKKGIEHINGLNQSIIQDYIIQMYPCSPSKKHFSLNLLKIFFRYLFENLFLPIDYSKFVPKDNYKYMSKLPSTYSQEEISTFLKVIDRGNPKGRRNYSMLLLAIRLGLRASDICALQFENISWERNTISLHQYKTGKLVELPLLPEIGNALIDYFKHGRPVSSEKYCFLHTKAPYCRLHNYDLGNMVSQYFQIAKIDCLNRHHGPHAFRHSLVDNLFKKEIPLPVITSVLGQTFPKSTMNYLRLDITSLRKCALEVPEIPNGFFDIQKGGYCHE